MSKMFWGILIAIVIIFGGAVIIGNHKNAANSPSNAKPTSHIEGEGKDGITLIEYGDYQCPVCGSFYQAVKDTAAKYNTQIKYQFRNLPLTSLHPNAFAGARAAEAAGLQGKFWQMHDLLYEQNIEYYNSNQTMATWISASDPMQYFQAYAQQLGLNVTKFKADYSSTAVNNSINADLAVFKKTGDEQATPTFYLNGKKLNNEDLISGDAPSEAAFTKVIDAAIATQKAKA